MWQELSEPILLLGLAGSAMLRGARRLLVWGTLILYLALSWVDRFGNWYQVIMPAYPLLLLGISACGPVCTEKPDTGGRLCSCRREGSFLFRRLPPSCSCSARPDGALRFHGPPPTARGRTEDTRWCAPLCSCRSSCPRALGYSRASDCVGSGLPGFYLGVRPDLTVLSSHEADTILRLAAALPPPGNPPRSCSASCRGRRVLRSKESRRTGYC